MRLVWHLIKKDAYRLRWDLLLYALFVLAGAVTVTFTFNVSRNVWACEWFESWVFVAAVSPTLFTSQRVLSALVFIIGTALVLPVQTLTLKIRRAVVVGVVSHLLFVFSTSAWSWDLLRGKIGLWRPRSSIQPP